MNPPSLYPKVSVIVPTYNRKHLLKSALNSIFEQTYPNIEPIVIDDCSTDGTSVWIKQSYPDINLISLSKNRGAAGARNVGINAAQGEYVAFLDSDDYWEPDYLKVLVSALSKDLNSSFSFCDHREVSKDTEKQKNVHYTIKDKYRDLTHRSLTDVFIFTMSVVLVRTSAIKKAGLLNEKLEISHDREFYIRLLGCGNMIHVPKALVTRVIHDSNISSDYRVWTKNVFMILDIYFSNSTEQRHKDLESQIRSDWALLIARESWQKEKDVWFYVWMLLKAFRVAPKKMLSKFQNKLPV